MRAGRSLLERFWQNDWSLSALLVLLVADIFLLGPLVQLRETSSVLVLQSSIYSIFLLVSVAVAFRRGTATLVVGVFAAVTFAVRWASHIYPSMTLIRVDSGLSLMFCVLLGAIILVLVFRPGPINRQRIEGAIAVYLLLGLAWMFGYELVALADPAAFGFPAMAIRPEALRARLLYFSMMTLTTVGYGDIAPVNPVACSLAGLEGVAGQLFPVILLSRLVSLELSHRQQRGR